MTETTRGRPRKTDPVIALEGAMQIFWAKGYDGASIEDLRGAMNIPRASLYHDYKDKQGLFQAAVAHYTDTRLALVADALDEATSPQQMLDEFLQNVIALGTSDPRTPGCLISCVLADIAGSNPIFQIELQTRLDALELKITQRLMSFDPEIDLAAPPDILAGLVAATARGLMLRCRAGDPAEKLLPLAKAATAIWCRPSFPNQDHSCT